MLVMNRDGDLFDERRKKTEGNLILRFLMIVEKKIDVKKILMK